jgi:hypothetical protein
MTRVQACTGCALELPLLRPIYLGSSVGEVLLYFGILLITLASALWLRVAGERFTDDA